MYDSGRFTSVEEWTKWAQRCLCCEKTKVYDLIKLFTNIGIYEKFKRVACDLNTLIARSGDIKLYLEHGCDEQTKQFWKDK